MRNLVRNAIILIVATLLAVFAIVPPEKTLRRGKDLAGGVSLIYSVDVRSNENASEVLSRVIEVLKERVDPKGLLEISLVAQGNDRIEITMPLPSKRVKNLRAEFEKTLNEAAAGWVDRDQLAELLLLPTEDRSARFAQLAGADTARQAALASVASAHDAMAGARQAYLAEQEIVKTLRADLDAAKADPATDPRVLEIQQLTLDQARKRADDTAFAAAQAEAAYDGAMDDAASAAISVAEMRRILRLADEPERLFDQGTDEMVELPSPRAEALERIKNTNATAAAAVERVVANWKSYQSERSTLDDPQDLIRLLKGAGVLNFRIAVASNALDLTTLREQFREAGPKGFQNERYAWFKINKISNWYNDVQGLRSLRELGGAAFFANVGYVVEEYDGEYFMLLWDVTGSRLTESDGAWSLERSFQTVDELGRPAIGFAMDQLGAKRLGQLTQDNIGQPMAVLLDDEVYTAPNINSRIASSGIIQGVFTPEELNYIIRVMSAGSLQAKLSPEPISTSIVGPELGADNLRQGLAAGVLSFIIVAAFMIFYYFSCGLISVIALLLNALMLVAVMALQHAAFTLPGIAGIALTFGQAIDANVLIYERMREELERGADLKTAVRLGHERAMSSIVDGNVTNLIVCVVLGFMGTQEIKGFAVTLGVGILTTLFMQLFATRIIFDFLVEHVGWRKARMLPMIIPGMSRALVPKIDWIGIRYVFFAITIVLTGLSIAMVAMRGRDLLDTEFRGGTAVTLHLGSEDGPPVKMERKDVDERLDQIADSDPSGRLAELRNADVIVVNPDAGGFTSSDFTIKTVITDSQTVLAAIINAFADKMESRPSLTFVGSTDAAASAVTAFPVVTSALGASIDRPNITADVRAFEGGVAFVLDNISPPTSIEALEIRIAQMRADPQFSDAMTRQVKVVSLEGDADSVSAAAIVVKDPDVSFHRDQDAWARQLRAGEWELLRAALTEVSTPASVQSFSPAIARTFQAQAIISVVLSTLLIIIYVWVRFSSLRFSVAAIITTLHDCIVAVGMVAAAGFLYEAAPQFAHSIGLRPFKFDLNLVAAVLTILGFSLNDTIIIMDRIRENRGKLAYANRSVINAAINQTISRTIITGGTTMISVIVLYVLGGEAIRQFAFALFVGVIVGTYSSIGVAAPMVWSEEHEHGKGRVPGILPRPEGA
ncbi:MAG: protein translocase subunit SecD [Phycisphaerales bacterium]|nr:protein translocase subunit SecD [Phycisphaerales bacterium]